MSATNPKHDGKDENVRTPEHEDTFFRDLIGYSIGTLGIHRLGYFWHSKCGILECSVYCYIGNSMVRPMDLLVGLVFKLPWWADL